MFWIFVIISVVFLHYHNGIPAAILGVYLLVWGLNSSADSQKQRAHEEASKRQEQWQAAMMVTTVELVERWRSEKSVAFASDVSICCANGYLYRLSDFIYQSGIKTDVQNNIVVDYQEGSTSGTSFTMRDTPTVYSSSASAKRTIRNVPIAVTSSEHAIGCPTCHTSLFTIAEPYETLVVCEMVNAWRYGLERPYSVSSKLPMPGHAYDPMVFGLCPVCGWELDYPMLVPVELRWNSKWLHRSDDVTTHRASMRRAAFIEAKGTQPNDKR